MRQIDLLKTATELKGASRMLVGDKEEATGRKRDGSREDIATNWSSAERRAVGGENRDRHNSRGGMTRKRSRCIKSIGISNVAKFE